MLPPPASTNCARRASRCRTGAAGSSAPCARPSSSARAPPVHDGDRFARLRTRSPSCQLHVRRRPRHRAARTPRAQRRGRRATQVAFDEERAARAIARAPTVASVVTSPPPTILGERAAHEIAIVAPGQACGYGAKLAPRRTSAPSAAFRSIAVDAHRRAQIGLRSASSVRSTRRQRPRRLRGQSAPSAAAWLRIDACALRRAPRARSSTSACSSSLECRDNGASSSRVGHGARCTDPSFHHDHTSSVANGKIRREQSQTAPTTRPPARVGRTGGLGALLAVPARLRRTRDSRRRSPRRTLDQLERLGVLVVARAPASPRRRALARLLQHAAIDAAGHRALRTRSSARTNFDAFSSLMASRRPTFICAASNTVSTPGPPLAAQ